MTGLIPLKFGVANEAGAPHVRFGIEKGFFADQGIDLSIHQVFGGPELAREFAEGRVKIGEFGSPPALTALGNGAAFKIIGGGARRKFLLRLAVRSDIDDPADLKGKRVGLLSPGSCDEWLARQVWINAGHDPDRDLEFVPMGKKHPEMLNELREGRIDAMLCAEPNLSQGESEGILRIWCAGYDPEYLPVYQWGVVTAAPDFIERDPDLIRSVLAGARQAMGYAFDHPDEWAAFFAAQHGVSLDIAQKAVARDLPLYQRDLALDLDGLQKSIELQYQLGGIPDSFSAMDVVDPRFAN